VEIAALGATRNGVFSTTQVTVAGETFGGLFNVETTNDQQLPPPYQGKKLFTPATLFENLAANPSDRREDQSIQRKSSSRTLMVRQVMDIPILESLVSSTAVPSTPDSLGNSSKLSKTAPMARVRPSAGSDLLKVEKREQNLRWLCKCR